MRGITPRPGGTLSGIRPTFRIKPPLLQAARGASEQPFAFPGRACLNSITGLITFAFATNAARVPARWLTVCLPYPAIAASLDPRRIVEARSQHLQATTSTTDRRLKRRHTPDRQCVLSSLAGVRSTRQGDITAFVNRPDAFPPPDHVAISPCHFPILLLVMWLKRLSVATQPSCCSRWNLLGAIGYNVIAAMTLQTKRHSDHEPKVIIRAVEITLTGLKRLRFRPVFPNLGKQDILSVNFCFIHAVPSKACLHKELCPQLGAFNP